MYIYIYIYTYTYIHILSVSLSLSLFLSLPVTLASRAGRESARTPTRATRVPLGAFPLRENAS